MSHMDLATAASIVAKSTSLFTPSQRQIEASSQVGYHDQPSADAPKVRAEKSTHPSMPPQQTLAYSLTRRRSQHSCWLRRAQSRPTPMNLTVLGSITPSRAMRVVIEHAVTSNVSDVASRQIRSLAPTRRGCFTLPNNSRRACDDALACAQEIDAPRSLQRELFH